MMWYPEIIEESREAPSCLTNLNYTRFVSYKTSRCSKKSCCLELDNSLLSFFHLASVSINTINSTEIYHATSGSYFIPLLSYGLAPVLKALELCMAFSNFSYTSVSFDTTNCTKIYHIKEFLYSIHI